MEHLRSNNCKPFQGSPSQRGIYGTKAGLARAGGGQGWRPGGAEFPESPGVYNAFPRGRGGPGRWRFSWRGLPRREIIGERIVEHNVPGCVVVLGPSLSLPCPRMNGVVITVSSKIRRCNLGGLAVATAAARGRAGVAAGEVLGCSRAPGVRAYTVPCSIYVGGMSPHHIQPLSPTCCESRRLEYQICGESVRKISPQNLV